VKKKKALPKKSTRSAGPAEFFQSGEKKKPTERRNETNLKGRCDLAPLLLKAREKKFVNPSERALGDEGGG